jgi:hypothetical protein
MLYQLSMKNLYILTLSLFTTLASTAQVVINEYSCSNRAITDAYNNYEDWIELYNGGSSAVNLAGYYLSDKLDNPTKWQFPAVSIPANGRLVVVCSRRNGLFGGVPHTNFTLTQIEPEDIVFSAPDGTLIESVPIVVAQRNHSRGRITDGSSTWGVFATPTYGTPNTGSWLSYTEKPVLSLAPGFYQGTQSVTMSVSDPSLTIRYTTNGSEPTTASTAYTGPISISQTTVVRARAFSTNAQIGPGFIETNTYFVNVTHQLPVVSVCGTQLGQLFGGSWGISPVGVLEYFETDGTLIDEVVGDFNKHGNDSWAYPQRGVDFVGRDEAGYDEDISHQLFITTPRDNFKRVILKAGANDNYPFSNGAHIRDAYVQSLSQLGNLDLDERSSSFVVVYLNGEYWGLYDIREKADDHDYTEYYYDQSREYKDSPNHIHYLKTWGGTWQEYGAPAAQPSWVALRTFILNNNMGDAANFQYVSDNFNWQSLIDYFVTGSVVVAADWLNWNTAWWRGTNPDGDALGWRYVLWDMDNTFGHGTNYTGVPNTGPTANPCNVENLNDPGGQGHTLVLNKLLNENPMVYQYYVTRYADLMNTTYSCQFMLAKLDSMVAVMESEMPGQIAKWGGTYAGWESRVTTLRNWIINRCTNLVTGMQDCYDLTGPYVQKIEVQPSGAGQVRLNTETITNFGAVRNVFGGIETILEALPQGNYQFSHWTFNNTVVTDPTQILLMIDINQNNDIVAHFVDITQNQNQLIYYWHFNNFELVNETPVNAILADYQLFPLANATMTYTGGDPNMDPVNTDGSSQNLQLGELAGKGCRVRNPSEGRSVVFNLPTTGLEEIQFLYSIKRTNSGQLINNISYSIDGVNYINAGLATTTVNITVDYQLVSVDFTDIPGVNDNPNFHIRIQFEGNTNQANGNNRFDNITLTGALINSNPSSIIENNFEFTVFPNPSTNRFNVSATENVKSYRVVDLLGKTIMHVKNMDLAEFEVIMQNFAPGVYVLELTTASGTAQTRIIKQ